RREIVLQRCKTRLDVVTPERRQPTRDRLSAHRVEALEITSQPVRELGAAALELQQVLAVGPAPTLLADAIGDRYPHVVEEHLVDLVVATHGADRPDRDPGRLHVDQQEADAVLLARPLPGAHQRE